MIFVTGDTHGEIEKKMLKQVKKGDYLIVCGDFGFVWSGIAEEKKKLQALEKCKGTILFLDGCHENFPLLCTYPEEEFLGGRVRKLCKNVCWLQRGEVYDIEGKSCFVFGGGESEDLDFRLDNDNWDEREVPTEEEMKNGLVHLLQRKKAVDYIFTHEAPVKLKELLDPKGQFRKSVINIYLQEIADHSEFKHWYFGHYHKDRRMGAKYTAVYCDILALPE